ncbi:glycosyltransferase family 2 protein [Ectobacillus panaciterrae]|uniref:glycosyltransferase family 2 protein n=1 Tax=Ectobacillus panaciterrae TaxID=363872 RepID=UPI00048D7831|nr:glycosyltransferase family 2 protein [Ectobacillus panaciterrae]
MWINNNTPTDNTPLTSIIILTFNGLSFTRECIFSIFQYTKENYELIVIDNGSTDGTLKFLRSLPNAKVIANQKNRGFSGGCNQGLSIAKGENIVLLNNDTVVTEGWLTRLLWRLNHDGSIGIVGPRSNIIVWHQAIMPVSYKSIQQMQTFASKWTKTHHRQGYEVDQLSGLCMVFKRSLIDVIGGLDERFFPGYYEDTDFCIRAQISEKKLWVANDVFIHHYGSSSFKLNKEMHAEILKESRQKFFDKWMMDDLKQIREIVEREKPFDQERHYIPF